MTERFRVRVLPLMLVACAMLPPLHGYALQLNAQIQLRALILSFFNLGLFITSLVTLKQYFWPGGNNTLPFQTINLVLIVLFYALGLPFLIANREYYEEYAKLTPISVLSKFFLSINISSFSQWVIIVAGVFNVLYILRYRRDYFHAGLGLSDEEEEHMEGEAPIDTDEQDIAPEEEDATTV